MYPHLKRTKRKNICLFLAITQEDTPTARPPSEVSLYLELMSLAVSHMVFTTLSKGT